MPSMPPGCGEASLPYISRPSLESISSYQSEQLQALTLAREVLCGAPSSAGQELKASLAAYLNFRRRVDAFLGRYFEKVCSESCYRSKRSACCSRDGIITYWADVVVNVLHATPAQLDLLEARLTTPQQGAKCVYLGDGGCLWRIRPIVCAMFLCGQAEAAVFGEHPRAKARWAELNTEKKLYTWPDRPVLFNDLESWFVERGYRSSLMYMHLSPGLVRLKQKFAV